MDARERAKLQLDRIKSVGYKAVGFNTNNMYSQVKGTVQLLQATIKRIDDAYKVACRLERAKLEDIIKQANDNIDKLDAEINSLNKN